LARDSGMDDLLTKPYMLEDLLALVARWIAPQPN
jgi:CheY-like chemotaxis protein